MQVSTAIMIYIISVQSDVFCIPPLCITYGEESNIIERGGQIGVGDVREGKDRYSSVVATPFNGVQRGDKASEVELER